MLKNNLNKKKGNLKKSKQNKFKSKRKLRLVLRLVTWQKKQSRIVRGSANLKSFLKKIKWKPPEKFLTKKRIAKKRQVYKYTYKHQKQMRFLRHMVKSRLPRLFFQPWKKTKLAWTEKQKWLHVAYNKYRLLRLKDRIDFFRTYVGKLLLETELASYRYPLANSYWLSRRKRRARLNKELEKKEKIYEKIWLRSNNKNKQVLEKWLRSLRLTYYRYDLKSRVSAQKDKYSLMNIHRRGWWYENLIQKRKKPLSVKRFLLDRPKTAFQSHWKQQKREPWKDSLIFKRALYSGFGEIMRKENKFRPLKMRFYLRHKNPRYFKRNRLYQRNTKLLANFRQRNRIRADKAARIKQIAGKILRPFYGHLRFKQMTKLVKKSRRIKSNLISRNEIILNHLENRLDVVVYRLNYAPSILWARRLILGGSIFVTNLNKTLFWDLMYSSLKKFSFPLKLRDPKKLYSKTLWKPHRQLAQYKFLAEPQKKISYLVQPEDVIQCAGGVLINHFKTDSILLQKPIPSHLLTMPNQNEIFWSMRFQQFQRHHSKEWEETTDTVKSAVFLHPAQFDDLGPHDRVQESFFRWAIL